MVSVRKHCTRESMSHFLGFSLLIPHACIEYCLSRQELASAVESFRRESKSLGEGGGPPLVEGMALDRAKATVTPNGVDVCFYYPRSG